MTTILLNFQVKLFPDYKNKEDLTNDKYFKFKKTFSSYLILTSLCITGLIGTSAHAVVVVENTKSKEAQQVNVNKYFTASLNNTSLNNTSLNNTSLNKLVAADNGHTLNEPIPENEDKPNTNISKENEITPEQQFIDQINKRNFIGAPVSGPTKNISEEKIISEQITKENTKPTKKNEEFQKNAKSISKKLLIGKSSKKETSLKWDVTVKNFTDGKILQHTTFQTDEQFTKMPFLLYMLEEAVLQEKNKLREVTRTQFYISSAQFEDRKYRVTTINMVNGVMVQGQKTNEAEATLNSNGVIGASNQITFIHNCDNMLHTLSVPKISLEVKCHV